MKLSIHTNKEKRTYYIGFIIFFFFTVFLTLNKHSKTDRFTYRSEIWGDKAGYYVYLPAVFKYNLDPNSFPDSVDIKTGNGFSLDKENNKVITKYTYGVAFMQLPFYLIAEIYVKFFNMEDSGFSMVHHRIIDIASIFYLTLGLFMLFKFLKFRFDKLSSILASLSVFLATNLYYYSIDETGMSHVYSFFLFSCFLYFIRKTKFLTKSKISSNLLLGVLTGLIILIRPTNIMFLSVILFLDISSYSEVVLRVKRIVNLKVLTPILLGVLLILIPQFLYWNYSLGTMFSYSYGDEGFDFFNPKVLEVWFSSNNGLFLYTPFYLLIIGSLFTMLKHRKLNSLFLIVLFFTITYVFSSWWSWNFGCAFGARSYVEYLTIFSIPVAYLFQRINVLTSLKMYSFYGVIILLIVINLKTTYSFGGCFYGINEWDWNWYLELIFSIS